MRHGADEHVFASDRQVRCSAEQAARTWGEAGLARLTLHAGSEAQGAELLNTYLARQAGGSTVAQTVAHPEEIPC